MNVTSLADGAHKHRNACLSITREAIRRGGGVTEQQNIFNLNRFLHRKDRWDY